MLYAGLDIGSRSTKLAVLDSKGELVQRRVVDTSFEPLAVCRGLLEGLVIERLVVTGYGRHLFQEHFPEAAVITEIKAVAIGARKAAPGCRTIVDVGGQDTKAISLDGSGLVAKFAMNDRCAAGTGRFLEVMATAMSLERPAFIEAALLAEGAVTLSSMCAVFAESEVISLIARSVGRRELARGIHEAVAKRVVSLLKSVPVVDELCFTGGGALNLCLHELVERGLGKSIKRLEDPQLIAALGCALSSLGETGAWGKRGERG